MQVLAKIFHKYLNYDYWFKRYYIQSALSLPDNEKIKQESRPFKNIDDSFKK